MIRYHFRRLGSNERGAAVLEFAIVALVFLLLVFGIINFGWVFHGYITLTGAAREGARLAIVGEDQTNVHTAVNNHARIFNKPLDYISPINAVQVREERVVEVTGTLDLLVPIFPFPNSITLHASATMRQEQE